MAHGYRSYGFGASDVTATDGKEDYGGDVSILGNGALRNEGAFRNFDLVTQI